MPTYSYKAITPPGVAKEGTLEAASEAQAVENLNAQGLIPIKISAGKAAQRGIILPPPTKSRRVCLPVNTLASRHHGAYPANVYHVESGAAVGSCSGYLAGNQR